MRRRIPVLIGFLWMIAVAVMAVVTGGDWPGEPPRSVYLSDSLEKGSEFEALCYSDGLYAVLTPSSSEDGEGRRIVSLSETGEASAVTPVLELESGGSVSALSVARDGFYLAVILDGGERAGVYFVESENLSEENLTAEETPEPLSLALVSSAEAGEGRQINWAAYEEGLLLTWKDDGTGAEYYEQAAADEADCEQLLMDMGQEANIRQFNTICHLVLLFAGWLLLFLVVRFLKNRSYTVYAVILVELLLLIITVTGVALATLSSRNTTESETERYSRYYLSALLVEMKALQPMDDFETEGFYQSDTYEEVFSLLSGFISDEGTGDVFTDLCILRPEDGCILLSASGKNGALLSTVYGQDAELLEADFTPDGETVYTLAAVRGDTAVSLFAEAESRGYLVFAVILFLAASAVCMALLLIRGSELRRFSAAMLQVSAGQEVPMGRAARSRDVAVMWNSLMELQKKIGRINYTRYRIFESCYRFAPKNIEKIFGRDSITEVAGGDTVRLHGMVAFVTTTEPQGASEGSAQQINQFVTLLERHMEESEGYFVSGNADLTSLKLLFLESEGRGVDFGVSFLREVYAQPDLVSLKAGILLHDSEFLYGVAGDERQSFPFLLSEDKAELERFADWFRSMDLRLVVTAGVREREKPQGAVRFIGYICLGQSGQRLDLYEMLEAYPQPERKPKIETLDRFEKALELFYQNDFYLARNAFSDVLKVNPMDRMARWYLFTCEKYLNLSNGDGDICRLRCDG
ncbi:MAG: hypothetical protein LIO67_10225 [Lachnospiraceae bacterium]|nr:hypothetical protein [Lachnospiraceae bacterium]